MAIDVLKYGRDNFLPLFHCPHDVFDDARVIGAHEWDVSWVVSHSSWTVCSKRIPLISVLHWDGNWASVRCRVCFTKEENFRCLFYFILSTTIASTVSPSLIHFVEVWQIYLRTIHGGMCSFEVTRFWVVGRQNSAFYRSCFDQQPLSLQTDVNAKMIPQTT